MPSINLLNNYFANVGTTDNGVICYMPCSSFSYEALCNIEFAHLPVLPPLYFDKLERVGYALLLFFDNSCQ